MAIETVRNIGSSCGEGEGTLGKVCVAAPRVVARRRDLAWLAAAIMGSPSRAIAIAR